jgi:glycerol-3-phosphate dehydrogenase
MDRLQHIEALKTNIFDVCIIGAGASGAGAALDAQLRGLHVALIDKEDFAAQTSSKSTKLIHGGVRYLEQAFKKLDFGALKQVKHGLEERHTVLKNAPHLTRPLALVTPCFSWIEGLYFSIGLRIYGWFAKNDVLPSSQWLNKKESLAAIKNLNPNIHSTIMYYDGQLDDARYCFSIAKTAAEKGAKIANYLEVIDFEKNNQQQLQRVKVKDLMTNEVFFIKAKKFINATGPFADKIRLIANPSLTKRLTQSKGVHVSMSLDILGSEQTALLIPKTNDGRVVFAIPWQGELLLGTTDTPYNEPQEEPLVDKEEIDYLLETLNRYLQQPADKSQVKAGFGGLRPLLSAADRTTKSLARDHEVEVDAQSGLISIMGGKWTTYRLMAKDTVDVVAMQLNNSAPCTTDAQILSGGENYNFDDWKNLTEKYDIAPDIAQNLLQRYGSNAEKIFQNQDFELNFLKQKLTPNYAFIVGEVAYAAKEEMATTIRDVLARRTRLELIDWQACRQVVPIVATVMATVLGWSVAQKQQQIDDYEKLLDSFIEKSTQ